MPAAVASSQQKKQQSISSFFSNRAPSTPAGAATKSQDGGQKRTLEPADETDESPPSKRQKTPAGFDDEGGGDEEATSPPQEREPLKRSPLSKPTRAVSDRTSRYLFSSTQPAAVENNDDEEDVQRKRKLHQRFVKKLGRPDSIAEIKRRNHFIDDPTAEGDDDQDEEDAEEASADAAKARKGTATKRGSSKLTPMEKQIIDIKRKHMDTVLVVEVGYKFRFFGEDARTAAKELSIVCIPGKFRYDEHPSEAHLERFASASIPVHRLHVHVRRLVAAGHKVGVVRQLETAALKAAGDNRNAPFVRKLTNLYTKGTYIDDVEGLEGPVAGPSGGAPATGHLLCLTETNAKGWGTDEKVQVGIVAVQPGTGDIIYDDLEDGFMRSEIETRLLHIAPCEFLIVGELSKATEKLIHHLSGTKTNVFGDKARVEHVEKPKTMAAQSYGHISKFYADKLQREGGSNDDQSVNTLDKVHRLTEHVTICLSAMINHLTEYGLEHVFDLTTNFQPFSARSHMLLNGNTLTSLEVYRNQTDYAERGSLFWVLDQTSTRFGQRLLRKWVGRPLLDKNQLQERIDAVEELKSGERTMNVDKLKNLLSKIKGDLEKSLVRIYYKKCSRPELLGVLQTLQRISTEYAHVRTAADAGFDSAIISNAIAALPGILDDVVAVLDRINPDAAKSDDKYAFLREEHETEPMTEHRLGIAHVESDLTAHLQDAAEKLRKKKAEYVTVAGIDYLIEVENTTLKTVPASWVKISGTKKVSRFHTPEVIKMVRQRDQHKEALAAACDDAFKDLLTEIGAKYQTFRDCIQSLAVLDCLVSLAEVAGRPGYCKPSFSDETRISVKAGRHPMVEQLLFDAYIANDVDLSSSGTRALLITGPNMGGKSSYVRQVALISIMAQCGSYVPADSAELGMLDAVFTRSGAFDNMMAGESTFMVELSETSDILKQATPRSLIILDELGRGTSTHDGVAIAHAVLDHIVRHTQSLLLFITHYQSLSTVANGFDENQLKNMHMRFTEGAAGNLDITFLYELGEGTAHRSYGLNVARLANVPKSVIDVAATKSKELELDIRSSQLSNVLANLGTMGDGGNVVDSLVSGIEQL